MENELKLHHLGPLWVHYRTMMTKEPVSIGQPYLWKKNVILDFVQKSAKEYGERRVVFFQNPGLSQDMQTGYLTHTLSAGIQYLLPGESASSHRHTQTAARFVLDDGHGGGYTTVEGASIAMKKGDYILTPSDLAPTWELGYGTYHVVGYRQWSIDPIPMQFFL